jgi:hypothetical protein
VETATIRRGHVYIRMKSGSQVRTFWTHRFDIDVRFVLARIFLP